MEHDAQKNEQDGQAAGQTADHAPVIDLGAARAKFKERKKRRESASVEAAARVREEVRRETAGNDRRYRFARGVQIAVLVIAVIYLLNTCGFLKF